MLLVQDCQFLDPTAFELVMTLIRTLALINFVSDLSAGPNFENMIPRFYGMLCTIHPRVVHRNNIHAFYAK